MISDLYPKARNPAEVKQLLDKYLTVKEDVDFDFEELLSELVCATLNIRPSLKVLRFLKVIILVSLLADAVNASMRPR